MKQVRGTPTYYDVLGITPSADAVVISATYRALIKKYHPDTNGGDAEATEKARQLNEAYEVLSDADARARYDYFTLGRWSAPTHPSRDAMAFASAYQFATTDIADGGRSWREHGSEAKPADGGRDLRLLASLAATALAVTALGGFLWLDRAPPGEPPPASDVEPLAAPGADDVGAPVMLSRHKKPHLTSAWLVGSWVVEGLSCQGDKVTTLAPDGSWSRQGSAGRWSLRGGRLHLLTTTLVEAAQQRTLRVPQSRSETITARGPREYKSVDDRGRVTIYDRCSPPPPV